MVISSGRYAGNDISAIYVNFSINLIYVFYRMRFDYIFDIKNYCFAAGCPFDRDNCPIF